MVASSTVKKPVVEEKAARGQTVVLSTGPDRDSGGDAGNAVKKMGGGRDSLAHSISDGKVTSY